MEEPQWLWFEEDENAQLDGSAAENGGDNLSQTTRRSDVEETEPEEDRDGLETIADAVYNYFTAASGAGMVGVCGRVAAGRGAGGAFGAPRRRAAGGKGCLPGRTTGRLRPPCAPMRWSWRGAAGLCGAMCRWRSSAMSCKAGRETCWTPRVAGHQRPCPVRRQRRDGGAAGDGGGGHDRRAGAVPEEMRLLETTVSAVDPLLVLRLEG